LTYFLDLLGLVSPRGIAFAGWWIEDDHSWRMDTGKEKMEPEHIYAVSGDGSLLGYATGDPKSIESYFLASCEVVTVHITRIKPLHIDASRLDRWRSLLAEREWIEAELKRINERMDEFSSGR
jgi:hypothetical protein